MWSSSDRLCEPMISFLKTFDKKDNSWTQTKDAPGPVQVDVWAEQDCNTGCNLTSDMQSNHFDWDAAGHCCWGQISATGQKERKQFL